MPVTLVDRLPLPNLKVYTATSVMLVSVAVYQAVSVTSAPGWRANATQRADAAAGELGLTAVPAPPAARLPRNLTDQALDVASYMMQEPLCMWTVINMCYCLLALAGAGLRLAVFGALRVAEAQRVKDKFWNYVFYKFIFVFGVLNVQYMDEVLAWAAWFTLLGFLHLLSNLCKDRFEYLSSSPVPSGAAARARLLWLEAGVAVGACALLAAAPRAGPHPRDTFAFMLAECILVAAGALHVLCRGALAARGADAAGPLAYYTHLAFDAVCLSVEALHVVHMVVFSRLVVSMPSLVLLLQLRHLLHQLHARLRKHRLYTALAHHMTTNYPMASKEEVERHQDNCAICWEPMREARKLPCQHLFHNSCLCQWVQQDASCPTCRRALAAARPPPPDPRNHLFHFDVKIPTGTSKSRSLGGGARASVRSARGRGSRRTAALALAAVLAAVAALALARRVAAVNSDGSRYVSWLPSFSVEVTRVRGRLAADDELVAQVAAMFPQFPRGALAADLAATRSADLTIDNILEGRLEARAEPPVPVAPLALTAPPVPAQSVTVMATPAPAGAAPVSPPLVPDTQDESPTPGAATFGGAASEREGCLAQRKQALLAAARRRFLARNATPAPPSAQASHAAAARPAPNAPNASTAPTAPPAQNAQAGATRGPATGAVRDST